MIKFRLHEKSRLLKTVILGFFGAHTNCVHWHSSNGQTHSTQYFAPVLMHNKYSNTDSVTHSVTSLAQVVTTSWHILRFFTGVLAELRQNVIIIKKGSKRLYEREPLSLH